ncbi:MAG TPA: glutathione peroxidase [Candidatus Hydrogenedentes bacterium]|nr:glutathione peroxidase [Candidatus Hydrogenedentota bacterium]HPG65726.1 glutathione peroxidase [Candidatus Hydrogenedentota bacterium]
MTYLLAIALAAPATETPEQARGAYVLAHSVESIDGETVPLEKYKGKVLLIVNVASKCGFTPQYKSLQALHERYADQGLAVLGFPANDFLWQEPGSNEEIQQFCSLNYHVTFDLFAKIHVRGKDQAPLYQDLTSKKNRPFGGGIKWNFTKFVVGRDGRVSGRFAPSTDPDSAEVTRLIEKELEK